MTAQSSEEKESLVLQLDLSDAAHWDSANECCCAVLWLWLLGQSQGYYVQS
jgi:hypothetical protein